MAKRKIELFTYISNEKEFEHELNAHADSLICAEVYSNFAGHCTALDRLFTTIKLDWSDGKMILLKVPADEIEVLRRFRNQSEPVYLFILRGKVTKVFRGIHSLQFAEVAKKELHYYKKEKEGVSFGRHFYELDEPTPNEMDWLTKRSIEKHQETAALAAEKAARQAERKWHRAELMVPHLRSLNFVLFWPHCFHAHPELYERWDANNIIMVGREVLDLTEDKARDILYAGDAPLNEASLLKLQSGPALAICFRLLDDDKHFVSLTRKILYEDIPEYDDRKSVDEQFPRMTAFDYYRTFSPTREEIWQKRREDKTIRKEKEREQRARRLSEMQRLARQAIEDAIEAKKIQKEQKRLELLKTGDLSGLKILDEATDDNEIDIEIPEELPDTISEDASSEEEEEDEKEYFPPPGLPIPGFYSPPNDIAKANGLAILFPKLVSEYVTPQPEFLPSHVLVMLEECKRHKAIKAVAKYRSALIHMGVFKASTPYDSVHLAYSVKQYDTLDISSNPDEIKLSLMLSIENDLPLLELMELTPAHVSRDPAAGERECAALFPVNYADQYNEFEDFEQ